MARGRPRIRPDNSNGVTVYLPEDIRAAVRRIAERTADSMQSVMSVLLVWGACALLQQGVPEEMVEDLRKVLEIQNYTRASPALSRLLPTCSETESSPTSTN